jgi:YidC/Oxa1 family membrane protein insertase
MELWNMWTHLLEAAIGSLAMHFGLSEALAIIVFTIIMRAALMPISLTAAVRMQKNKEAVARIKPVIEALRDTCKDNPKELAARTMALYRENGISFFDRVSLFNLGTQTVIGLGLFQTLKRMTFGSRFLWIANLAKPDFALTVLVGAVMLLGMVLMPGSPAETSTMLTLAIPALVSVIAIAALPSALGIYWATSNAMTVVQAIALRGLLVRQRNRAMHSAS